MKNIILAVAFLASTHSLQAQASLAELADNGLKAMNEGKWEEALKINTEAVTQYGEDPADALMDFGPQFGVLWFRKGMCELKLKKFEDAMKSFEATYKDFPNDPKAKGKNPFNKVALLKWGDAAMALGEYEVAIEQWKKFLEERGGRDDYPKGQFHVNMAISHYQLGKLVEGNEHLEIAINNKMTFPTMNTSIVSGFQSLVNTAIKANNEQVILDFVAKNRGPLTIAPFEMQRFSKILVKLAGDAIKAQMPHAALALYGFVPSTQVSINGLRTVIKDMGKLPILIDGATRLNQEQMKTDLAALEAEQRGSQSMEMIKLAALAYIYESQGYTRGAYAAYLQLENEYPKAAKREDNIFHLIRTASVLGKIDDIQKYSAIALKTFPNSKFTPDTQKLMLSSLFFERKYEESLIIANDLLDNNKVAEGTPQHDLALFVRAGSYFYTGQYDKAKEPLDEHVKMYPESQFAMTVAYFQASNAYRTQYLKKAAKLLDAFIAKYKDSDNKAYMPLALFDRANTHYMQDEMDATLEKLDRLVTGFPDSPLSNQALILKGNVLESENKLEEAEASYVQALSTAEERGNNSVASEALSYLIPLLAGDKLGKGANSRLKDAVPYADKYWEKFADGSPYRAQIAVAQVPALVAVERSEDALSTLQMVISDMAKTADAVGLEDAIKAYTIAYLEKNTPEQLKEHYYNFPDIQVKDKVARALLRIAVIGVYESVLKDAEEENEKRQAQAMIQVLFQNLKTEFEVKDLSNFILVTLGDYLRVNTSAPVEAVPYYDEALSRQDRSYRYEALLGRADVYGNSDKEEDIKKAIEDFEIVLADGEKSKQQEFALYRIIQILYNKADFAGAAKRANQYLNKEKEAGPVLGFKSFTAEVGLILAQTFDKRGMIDDAIVMYSKVFGAHMGYMKISAPAMYSWMELLWKRNKISVDPNVPGDRQGAYNGGYLYIKNTSGFKDKLTPEEVMLWNKVDKLTKQYVRDPRIKSAEQIEKEKAEAEGR